MHFFFVKKLNFCLNFKLYCSINIVFIKVKRTFLAEKLGVTPKVVTRWFRTHRDYEKRGRSKNECSKGNEKIKSMIEMLQTNDSDGEKAEKPQKVRAKKAVKMPYVEIRKIHQEIEKQPKSSQKIKSNPTMKVPHKISKNMKGAVDRETEISTEINPANIKINDKAKLPLPERPGWTYINSHIGYFKGTFLEWRDLMLEEGKKWRSENSTDF